MKYKLYIAITWLLVLFLNGLNPLSAGNDEGRVALNIRLAVQGQATDGIFLQSGDKTVQLNLSPHRLSRPIRYIGPARLELFRTSTLHEGTEADRKTVALCDLSGMHGQIFLILVRDRRTSNERYHVLAIDANEGYFPLNHVFLQNLTAEPVAGYIGTARFELEPGAATLINYPGETNSRVVMLYRLASRSASGWELLLDSEMVFRGNDRRLMFFTDSGRDGATQAWVIDEHRNSR